MAQKEFIEITDLPQDKLNILHGARVPLVRAFNANRDYDYKIKALKDFCKFMHSKCVEAEKRLEAKSEAKQVKTETVVTETGE